MPKKIKDIKVGLDEDLKEKLQILEPNMDYYVIRKKSIDARKKSRIHFNYSVDIYKKNEESNENLIKLEPVKKSSVEPFIIGAGPAGLFAALRFIERGVKCCILEQGSETKERLKAIANHWRYGKINPNNNVCFGEGGAGLFSDGKLITRIKSNYIPYVMDRLVQFGAPQEIKYLSNPHVGSDKIRRIVPIMREFIKSKGGRFLFNHKVTDFKFENRQLKGLFLENEKFISAEQVILACGHSAEDLFFRLQEQEVDISAKDFAIGLRIEHPQQDINKIQYGNFASHPQLHAANYKLTHHNKNSGVGVYSFCMCPGGYILPSSTNNKGVVSNGMSNYNRGSAFANSALVISVSTKTLGMENFAGLHYRNNLEERALKMLTDNGGTKELPAQRLSDFLKKQTSRKLLKSSALSGQISTRLDQLFSDDQFKEIEIAIEKFEKKIPGFASEQAQLFGVESRTSSPIRIERNTKLESTYHKGLYPCGEGAGYAGGITSAACDGIRVAESIMEEFCRP